MPRGSLLVFEGGDGTGKTTWSRNLLSALQSRGHSVEYLSFPDRSSATGRLIDGYLKKDLQVDDRAIHLLFAANRWEKHCYIKDTLMNGTSIICDRYAVSGLIYSVIARHLSSKWCSTVDKGLVRPDFTFLMTDSWDSIHGDEKFEDSLHQNQIRQAFLEHFESVQDTSSFIKIPYDKPEAMLQIFIEHSERVISNNVKPLLFL